MLCSRPPAPDNDTIKSGDDAGRPWQTWTVSGLRVSFGVR